MMLYTYIAEKKHSTTEVMEKGAQFYNEGMIFYSSRAFNIFIKKHNNSEVSLNIQTLSSQYISDYPYILFFLRINIPTYSPQDI